MGNSLFDQLKKSGLVDKQKAQKIKQNQYKKKKQKSKKGTEPIDEAKLASQKAHQEKVERDRQLNLQKTEETERKAIAAQIRLLIEANCIKDREGDVIYNFTDNTKVKRLYLSEQVHKHLTSGRLAIAKLGDSYELVPTPVAEKIKQRDDNTIISLGNPQEQRDDENDPYADYKIPDDLMW